MLKLNIRHWRHPYRLTDPIAATAPVA
jgi:hypothetical protein